MSKEELIEKTDSTIAELVKPKTEIQKAYNYYAGLRDAEQFRYLEENYGVGNPTNVEFTPLVKKHIDALIGEFLGVPITPKISCKDPETISNIARDKQIAISKKVYTYLQEKINNALLKFINNKQPTDENIKEDLDKIIADLENDFLSEYEIASQNIITYILQDRRSDILTKLRFLFLDLLIAGYCMFRCIPSESGENINIEVLDPRNTFIDRNPESIYIKHSYRSVIRKWYNKEQILNKYGKDLKSEDLKTIKENWREEARNSGYYYIKGHPGHSYSPNVEGLDYGIEAQMGYPYDDKSESYNIYDLIPVYEVEWIQSDKNFVMNRYQTIRIGENIYILKGKAEDVIRTKSDPTSCTLSINGIYFTNRSSKPFSLMLSCMNLQDKYDLILYIRDSVLANSGTIGDYIDMSLLPTWLGTEPAERLQKYLAYKKIGIGPIDSSQEGRLATGQAPLNTIFNGYDDTVKVNAIQALQLCIQSIEETVSSITGVFRERLNGIEQRDAVSNIKQGVQNSFIISKQYYQQMDITLSELLTDALNIAKIVYKNGLTGTIILGEKYQKIFTALPEHFTLSDWDVHVSTSTELMQEDQIIKQLVPELIRAGAMAPDVLLEIMSTKSITKAKSIARHAVKKQKEENNHIQKLQQQLQEVSQQAEQMQKQLQEAQQKVQQLNEAKMKLEMQKIQQDAKIAWYEAQTDRDYKNKKNEIESKKVEVELAQLTDGNPYNDKVNFNK